MLASNAKNTLTDVENVTLTRPEKAGAQWKGVEHKHLIRAITINIATHAPRFHLSRDDADLDYSAIIKDSELKMPDGFEASIALSTSNARRRGLVFYGGLVETKTKAAICVSSSPGFEYRQTVNLEEEVATALDVWSTSFRLGMNEIKILQTMKLKDTEVEKILFCAGRHKVLSWSRVGAAWGAWKKTKGESRFDLLKCLGMGISKATPYEQLTQLNKARNLMVSWKITPDTPTLKR